MRSPRSGRQTRVGAALFALALLLGAAVGVRLAQRNAAPRAGEKVTVLRTPGGGIQPQAVMDKQGTLHLIYFSGEPGGGDIFYVHRAAGQNAFSSPLRINSQPGSAIATGTIRGAHLAIGRDGASGVRVHVAWMGSKNAVPQGPAGATPMLYARLNEARTAFEPQRNVLQFAAGLDGGGSVAADGAGHVYVAWHARGDGEGEEKRRVWLARSEDDGRTFARETAASMQPTGVCGCCGMRAFADESGGVHLLYRAATEFMHRDMWLLSSTDQGRTFRGRKLHPWQLDVCPMSTTTMAQAGGRLLAAWETMGQVYYAGLDSSGGPVNPIAAPGEGKARKHPAIAGNAAGETLLVWAEGTGWKKGGSLAWQVFDRDGQPTAERGAAEGVPVWSLPTAVVDKAGKFVIVY